MLLKILHKKMTKFAFVKILHIYFDSSVMSYFTKIIKISQ